MIFKPNISLNKSGKFTQIILPGCWVGIRNISDYSPFGVLLPERTVENDFFRTSFQGQEHDDEVKGKGNSVNFTFRMHDPRVGRFFTVDPLKSRYPSNSPYSFSENRVIDMVELEGQEKESFEQTKSEILKRMGTGTVISKADKELVVENVKLRGYILHSELIFFVLDPSKVRQTESLPVPVGGKSFTVRQDHHHKAEQEAKERVRKGLPAVTDDAPGTYQVMTGAGNLRGLVDEYPPLPPDPEPIINVEDNSSEPSGSNDTPLPLIEGKPPIVNGVPLEEGEKVNFDINANFGDWNSTITNRNEITRDLDALARSLKSDGTLHIWISGLGLGSSTDVSPKNAKYTSNMCLFDRAKAIRTELINRGVKPSQITIGAPKTVGRRGVQITTRNLKK